MSKIATKPDALGFTRTRKQVRTLGKMFQPASRVLIPSGKVLTCEEAAFLLVPTWGRMRHLE